MAEISKEEKELVIERLKNQPSNMKLAHSGGIYTIPDMIKEIEKDSDVGKELLEMQINYLKHLKKK